MLNTIAIMGRLTHTPRTPHHHKRQGGLLL